jgi:hypothetical protein
MCNNTIWKCMREASIHTCNILLYITCVLFVAMCGKAGVWMKIWCCLASVGYCRIVNDNHSKTHIIIFIFRLNVLQQGFVNLSWFDTMARYFGPCTAVVPQWLRDVVARWRIPGRWQHRLAIVGCRQTPVKAGCGSRRSGVGLAGLKQRGTHQSARSVSRRCYCL